MYKPMIKYRLKIETTGTDVYEITSDLPEDRFLQWAQTHVESIPKWHNSIEDRKVEEVIQIEVVDQRSDFSSAEAYDKLVRYIMGITSNSEPLELLKQLKPEEEK
jgi:hypothetical protein